MDDNDIRLNLRIYATEDVELFMALSNAKNSRQLARRVRGLLRAGLAAERGVFSTTTDRPASPLKHKPPPVSDDGLSDLDPSKFQFTKDC